MLKLRTEEEIIASWKGDLDKPVVSICCLSYNHEKYIEDAIRGFLIQETDFPVEIIIHDDASTDNTANIINSYQMKYPRLFKTITQTKNQWSTGIDPFITYINPMIRGDFIALCEGDDYWNNRVKLRNQVNELNNNPSVDLCFHPSYVINILSSKKKIKFDHGNRKLIIDSASIIAGGGGFIPTASIVVRRTKWEFISDFIRKHNPYSGDYVIQVISSIPGGGLYIPLAMCVYRKGVASSLSSRVKLDKKAIINYYDSTMRTLDALSELEGCHTHSLLAVRTRVISYALKHPLLTESHRKEIYRSQHKHINLLKKILWHIVYKSALTLKLAWMLKELLYKSRNFSWSRSANNKC